MSTAAGLGWATAIKAAFWIPLAFCLAMAFTPNPPETAAQFGDVATHLGAFAYLTVALFPAHFPDASQRMERLLAVALWMFAVGVLIEVGQLFIAGRSGEFGDLAVNAIGILLGGIVYESWSSSGLRGQTLLKLRTLAQRKLRTLAQRNP